MDAVRLSRVTTVLVVAGVGGVAGHVLWPFAPGAGIDTLVVLTAVGEGR